MAQLVFAIIASLLVAVYHGRKLSFSIPSIFLLPFAALYCNHVKETSEKIVQCLSIWSLLLFILHVCYHASFIFLALLARPPIVISTALLIIFAAFYSVHLLAILFTFVKVKKRQQGKTYVHSIVIDLAQTVVVMVVFAAAICFGSVIGYAGMSANYGNHTIGLGWALQNVGTEWLRSVTSPDEAEQAEMVPLLQETKQKVSVNPKAGGDPLKMSTLMGCLMQ